MVEIVQGLPYSQAAENNRVPILAQLQRLLAGATSVLELGAGSGQHAVAFAQALPHLCWQPTETPQALPALRLRCDAEQIPGLAAPVALDIAQRPWGIDWPDAVYTANTLHIVSRDIVRDLFAACAEEGKPGSRLVIYGPFNYGGEYTSESNERFDAWLKERDKASAIRDFEWVDDQARMAGYVLLDDIAMPANNRLICWQKDGNQR